MSQENESKKRRNPFMRFCEKHRFSPVRVIVCIVVILLLVGGGAAFGVLVRISSHPVRLGFANIGELATQSCYFTSVQDISKTRTVLGINVPFTTSKYIFSYDGTIKAGLDFEKIEIDEDIATHTVRVTLPEVRIHSTEIDTDSLRIYDERKNIFSPLKLDNVNTSLAALKEEAQKTSIDNGILDNARDNAKILIRGFLSGSYSPDEWTFDFVDQTTESR